jgi:hypothetical protein
MRCVFRRADCGSIPDNTACFECEHCHKRALVPVSLAERVVELTQAFPDCAAQTAPPPGPSTATPMPPPPAPQPAAPAPPAQPYQWDPAGAGTQLKKLLAKVGITSTENCSCNARAKLMNERGLEWCEQNIPEIIGWLKEEAAKRKLPFLSLAGKIIIQRAIKIAKKVRTAQAAAAEQVQHEAESSSIVLVTVADSSSLA